MHWPLARWRRPIRVENPVRKFDAEMSLRSLDVDGVRATATLHKRRCPFLDIGAPQSSQEIPKQREVPDKATKCEKEGKRARTLNGIANSRKLRLRINPSAQNKEVFKRERDPYHLRHRIAE
ncbi:uncharacterized protein [Linepithema humile]|uniref:uncharacterized protein isoform X2 n=1 Tax=Linepithema humile TaxID=83485 RepID=UPI00351F75C9